MSSFAIAVDVGGTFTDVTLWNLATAEQWSIKTPTTPADPSIGFLDGVDEILQLASAAAQDIAHVWYGTTISTNAILESKGVPTGLVTTRGFRYVLEIGRHDGPRWANRLTWLKPQRPVSPENVLEISERMLADGSEFRPLNESECRAAARYFKSRKIESIAICFLHSYSNPAHEERAREVMQDEYPDACFSISAEVLPVFREYERSMATVLNSYVMPLLNVHISNLRAGLHERLIRAPLYIMKSNGGVIGADTAISQAAFTALSGPAAGVVAVGEVGAATRLKDLISIDVGGTSADVCVVRHGMADVTTEGQVGTWPFAAPMIDIHTVGAGGGSIASVTSAGTLVVGPASAGAAPGPACYGRGGELPCVTDANLVLGRLPAGLAGGGLVLDVAGARRSIQGHVADPLGIDVVEAAAGIIDVIDNNLAGAIRVITIERGIDPRAFALLGFGGAGPLHASSVARLLKIPAVLIPRSPGVLSTLGLLTSDIRNDFALSLNVKNPTAQDAAAILKGLDEEARNWLAREGIPEAKQAVTWHADLRYPSQVVELLIDVPAQFAESPDLAVLHDAFHAEHERRYGYRLSDSEVELVTLRASAIGHLSANRERLGHQPPPSETVTPPPIAIQPVFFKELGDFTGCPVYDREQLRPGNEIPGPAMVVQMDTTTIVLPGQLLRVDRSGNLVLTDSTPMN